MKLQNLLRFKARNLSSSSKVAHKVPPLRFPLAFAAHLPYTIAEPLRITLYSIFRRNNFRVKRVYQWRRRFLTLSRNKWTFKLQPRAPPVVRARGPFAMATDNGCSAPHSRQIRTIIFPYLLRRGLHGQCFVLRVITSPGA